MTRDEEIVFEILAEGGSLTIVRRFDNNVETFHYNHNENDRAKNDLEISENGIYDNFEKPFQIINKRYPWFLLFAQTIQQDFKLIVLDTLISQLNQRRVTPSDFENSRTQLEEILGVKLEFGKIPNKDGFQEIIVKVKVGKITEMEYNNYSSDYFSDSTKSDDLKIIRTKESFDTKEYKFKGKLEITGPTVVIRDFFNNPQFIFSSEQAIVTTKPIFSNQEGWFYNSLL